MLEIKTITSQYVESFDYSVNEALKEGWELVRRECFVTGSDRAITLYAELKRVALPFATEPTFDEYEVEARWVRDPQSLYPYQCSECGFHSSAPYPICPSCNRLMADEIKEG